MLKDFFQRNIDLTNQLRSEHFKYVEYLNRGKYNLKQKFFGKGKKHYDFDINSQQYFHQQINDIAFESSQAQQQFFNLITSTLKKPINVKCTLKQSKIQQQSGCVIKSNPSDCRVTLSRHFSSRAANLRYKKYLLLERFYNLQKEQELPFIQSRTTLIDKQIQSCLSRQCRLSENDYFQESFIQGGKPVPISQTGQPIYKYLDQEECWYSNISRDDIIVYTRNIQFKRQLLNQLYFPIESQFKSVVFRDGLQILFAVEQQFQTNRTQLYKKVQDMAKQFNFLVEKELQVISPGNLVQKQNLSNFGYTIFGILSQSPLRVALYPAIYPQLLTLFNKSSKLFFKNLQFSSHQSLISLLPKLNSFCQILFKYQNKQILEGKKEIKLGLDDDIDVRKQLYTMLEEVWVKKYVNLGFQRFDYKLQLKPTDWPMETLTQQVQRQSQRHKPQNISIHIDNSIEQLIKLLAFTDFFSFRKHLKKRSQKIVERAKMKYLDMENINKYNQKSDQQMTLQQLSDLFRMKFNKEQIQNEHFMKGNSQNFFNQIMKKYWIVNPAEIQIEQTIKTLKIRQKRIKIMNLLNGMRCYHRNLCLDLRVLSGEQFKFKLDDEFLINSNKQVVQNFEKAVKQTATFFTAQSNNQQVVHEQFQQPISYHSRQMLYKKDTIECFLFNQTYPHVLVFNGKRRKSNILYGVVIQKDLKTVEQRIMHNATKVINQYERYVKIKTKEEIVDRVELLLIFYDLQLRYHYQKFKLIQKYYYIYQNTTNLLQAFKISKMIVSLIHKKPQFDSENVKNSFQQIYEFQINALQEQQSLLQKLIQKLKNEQVTKVQVFHHRYSQLSKVPLSAQVYLYRDIEQKQKKKDRLQRINSLSSSKMSSKSSKNGLKNQNLQLNVKQQIKQQFDQDQSQYGQESFDIQNYDQYLLKKDMDSIFDDMIQNNQNKDATPVNTAALQNIVVSPRFQGGPHPYNFAVSQLKITSNTKSQFLNFYQSLAFAANVREIVQNLQTQFINLYGYISISYQNCLRKIICKMMNKILLKPVKSLKKWKDFQSYDTYHESVTSSSRFYEQIMSPCLQPPSNIQMAISSTLQKHQQKLPTFNMLGCLDYHSIQSLITLKKPLNTASYRQLALGINYISYLNIKQSIYHVQLKRQRLIQSYQQLARNCQAMVQRYGSMYSRSGQSDVLLSIQQIKMYKQDLYHNFVMPETIQQLNTILKCQKADIKLFQTLINISKIKLEDFVIMKQEVGRNFYNTRFDNSRLLALDQKNVKMIKNRIKGEISFMCSQQLKQNSFLKIKQNLKTKFQKLIKQITQTDQSSYLVFPKQKLSQFSKSLLQDKFKRKLTFQLIQCYTKDLNDTHMKYKVFVETDSVIRRLRRLIQSAPYLAKAFDFAPNYLILDKKIYYDQKKSQKKNFNEQLFVKDGKIALPKYIYSRYQLSKQWSSQETLCRDNNLSGFKMHQLAQLHPPKQKDLLFKWIYKIPDFSCSSHQSIAIQHLISLCSSFTGKISQSQYTSIAASAPNRNIFYTIYNYYKKLLQYIESNFLLITLQMDDQILNSFMYLQNNHVQFQKTFGVKDDLNVHQSLQQQEKQYLKTCFNYINERGIDKNTIRQRFKEKKYLQTKQHWAVYDQILDFIIAKVQGRGLLRQNFLPFFTQLQSLLQSSQVFSLLEQKVSQLQQIFLLSSFEAYVNQQQAQRPSEQPSLEISQTFYPYLIPIQQWFLGNGLEYYRLQGNKKGKVNITKTIAHQDQQQMKRFRGLFDQTTNTVAQRYKSLIVLNSIDLAQQMKEIIKVKNVNPKHINQASSLRKTNSNNQDQQFQVYNFSFLAEGVKLFNQMGQNNRLKIFARMRYYYQKVAEYLKIKNSNFLKGIQNQQTKLNYIKFLLSSKMQTLSTIAFSQKLRFPLSAKSFKSASIQLKQSIQISSYTIYEKFQQYKSQNKIQFSKSQLKMLSSQVSSSTHENNLLNLTIREIISSKLTREQLKSKVLLLTIQLLRNQKIQTVEPKKIINTSLIPRVHLISSYSSPLILDRKTFIGQQYKLAFAQAFINRFRNKVSRVDLLSSGYGFVITVPDLQDCVNFMNKLLFTFAQKQFKYRQQTHFQYFQIMVDAVNQKNRNIKQQQQIIQYLQQKLTNIMEAQYLGKVTKLLHQKTVIQDKLRVIQQNTHGLQDRIRKTVEVQYEKKMNALQQENELLKKKFNQFKQLFVILTKDSAKNNFLNVANIIRQKVGDLLNKRIDVTESFITSEQNDKKQKTKQRPNRIVKQQNSINQYNRAEQRIANQLKRTQQKDKKQSNPYISEDLQRCKLGQDIIHDPYYTTKLITKMRLFNIFKLGCKKMHFDDGQRSKNKQLKELHKIQDAVIAQSERQILVRQQLKRTQQQLSKKLAQLQKTKQSYQNLQNQRTKLKILLTGKDKKIEQKQRQASQALRRLQQAQKQPSQSLIQSKNEKVQQGVSKVSELRVMHKKKHRIERSPFLTNPIQPAISINDRFQLSNKDATWRQKCQQLYIENKKLLSELQKVQTGLTTPTRDAYSLNLRQRKKSQSLGGTDTPKKEDAHRRFPNLSFKYGLMKQNPHNLI